MTVLYTAYRAYCIAVAPLTTPVGGVPDAPIVERAEAPIHSHALEVAQRHLPQAPWASEAKKGINLNLGTEGYAYFEEIFRIEDDRQNRVRLSPFALVWFNPQRADGQPYTILCGSAVVEFENKFAPGFGDSDPGRIVGAELMGDVQVSGPDGLRLVGRNIVLSEKQRHLYSDSMLKFEYGPVPGETGQIRGSAEGFQVTLATDDESLLGDDLPRISGMEKIVLRRNVVLDIVAENEGRMVPVALRSKESFEYFVDKRVATFHVDVEATRPTHLPGQPEEFDRLNCDQLTLLFEPKPDREDVLGRIEPDGAEEEGAIQTVAGSSSAGRRRQKGLDLNLQLTTLTALGRQVRLKSDERDIEAWMGELRYDVPQQLLMMHDEQEVQVQVGAAVLACPEIRLAHTDTGIAAAVCQGMGHAWHTNVETGQVEAKARWNERLTMSRDPVSNLDIIELRGDAQLVHQPQQVGIVADVLRGWFDPEQLEASSQTFTNGVQPSVRSGGFPLHRVLAEQTGDSAVTLVSPAFQLETGRLEVDFKEADRSHPLDERAGSSPPFSSTSQPGESGSPVIVKAGDVQASVLIWPGDQQSSIPDKFEVARLTAGRAVEIVRIAPDGATGDAPTPTQGAFGIWCEQLSVVQEVEGHVLQLIGAPARIRVPDAEIEGNELYLDRGRNEARVAGPGTIIRLVEEGFDGRPLEEADRKLSIRWRESMHFDGQLAQFIGQTETRLASSAMTCDKLDVTLNQRVDFSENSSFSKDIDVAKLLCRDGVSVKSNTWKNRTEFVGTNAMHVAEFFYNRSTGEFRATGPGRIEDWQRGQGQQRINLGPAAVTNANQSAKTQDLEWNYTLLTFQGDMKGHEHNRYLELHDRVEVLHGPVREAWQPIVRDDLDENTETAKNSVWLESDQMNLYLRPGTSPKQENWVEVVAFGNARLEGKVFGANADSIKYDQSKEQFTLRGQGSEAGIWYQEVPGREARTAAAQTIIFVPSKKLILDGTSGVRFSQ